MASERVIGTELVNEDNSGYYMADGALYTYVHGDEYHNIFPFLNWRRTRGLLI
ncbi:MAG: polysaccharide lyase family 8 super-sandwich domain-containing protein [Bacteroides xylanisolvens]